MAIQNLNLEEQEKLDALKAWWKENGRLIMLAVVAAAIAVAGVRGWQWYMRSQSVEGERVYAALAKAARAGNAKGVREAGGALSEHYARTLYASMGALTAAHFHVERGELKSAKAQLQWVIEHTPSEDFRDLARLRLAGILLDEKANEEALKLLEEKPQDAYAAQYAALRGDVLVAMKRPQEARAAYRQALDKLGSGGGAFRDGVQLRLDALGG